MEYFTAYKKPPHIPALGRSWKALRECERPFDSRYSISFWYTFGNEPLSLTVFEIFASEYYVGHDLDLLESRDVIQHVTIGYPRFHFLYVFHGNRVCISSCYEIMGPQNTVVTTLIKVTWRHRSRDHSIRHMPFPVGDLLEPSFYLHFFEIFGPKNVNERTNELRNRPTNESTNQITKKQDG